MSHHITYDTKLNKNEWGFRKWSCSCGTSKETWNTDHGTQKELENHIKPRQEEKENHNIEYGYDTKSKTWWWRCWCGASAKFYSEQTYAEKCAKKHLDDTKNKEDRHTLEVLRNNLHSAYNTWTNLKYDRNHEIKSLERLSILAYRTLKQLKINKDAGVKQ